MNLNQLNETEVTSLICGQVHRVYNEMNTLFSTDFHEAKASDIGKLGDILSHLRTSLTRILDLIEEVGPRGKGTRQ